jgi:hypothetical protein
LNTKEIDQLAKRLAALLKNSLFTYPMTDDFEREENLVQWNISDADYKLSERFRSSFDYYLQDLVHIDLEDEHQRNAYHRLMCLTISFNSLR